MLFGLKNVPPTYQKAVNKAFKDYLDDFMKLFLDDFTTSNDLDTHLSKLWWCFEKCWEYGINLNLEKCAFMVFWGMILRFIISKEGKLLNSKKVEAIVQNTHAQESSWHPSFQWLGPILPMFCKNICLHYGTKHKTNAQIRIVHLDMKEPRSIGRLSNTNMWRLHFNCSKLGEGISCTHGHLQLGSRNNVGPKSKQ